MSQSCASTLLASNLILAINYRKEKARRANDSMFRWIKLVPFSLFCFVFSTLPISKTMAKNIIQSQAKRSDCNVTLALLSEKSSGTSEISYILSEEAQTNLVVLNTPKVLKVLLIVW